MNRDLSKPEAADSDPFAGLNTEVLPSRKAPKLPTTTLVRRWLACLLFLSGLVTVGAAFYLGLLEFKPVVVKLTVFGGLGICLLAFVLYDWHWPYKTKDGLKRLLEVVLELIIRK